MRLTLISMRIIRMYNIGLSYIQRTETGSLQYDVVIKTRICVRRHKEVRIQNIT
jgi:hypothetical protein